MNKFNLRDHDWVGYGVLFLAVFVVMSGPSNADTQSIPQITQPNIVPPQVLPQPGGNLQETPNEGGSLPSPSPNQTQPLPSPAPQPRPNPDQGGRLTEQGLFNLFANLQSPGVNAIGAAEGNRYPDGRVTPQYLRGSHIDPGNDVVNRGWCSDQSRGRNNEEADRLCLERTQSRLKHLIDKFKQASLDPTQHPEAWVNAVDQWNQASPRVSDTFPFKYYLAINNNGLQNSDLLWARIEAFRRSDGVLEANGLARVCRKNRYYQRILAGRTGEDWLSGCISLDQGRRIKEIRAALRYAKVIP